MKNSKFGLYPDNLVNSHKATLAAQIRIRGIGQSARAQLPVRPPQKSRLPS